MSHSFAKGFSLKKREMIKNRQFTKLKWKKWGKKGFYLLKPLIKCKNAEIIFVMTVQEGELTLYGLLALVCLNNPSAVPIQLVLTFLRLGGTSAQNVVRDSAPLSKKLRLLLLQIFQYDFFMYPNVPMSHGPMSQCPMSLGPMVR